MFGGLGLLCFFVDVDDVVDFVVFWWFYYFEIWDINVVYCLNDVVVVRLFFWRGK